MNTLRIAALLKKCIYIHKFWFYESTKKKKFFWWRARGYTWTWWHHDDGVGSKINNWCWWWRDKEQHYSGNSPNLRRGKYVINRKVEKVYTYIDTQDRYYKLSNNNGKKEIIHWVDGRKGKSERLKWKNSILLSLLLWGRTYDMNWIEKKRERERIEMTIWEWI